MNSYFTERAIEYRQIEIARAAERARQLAEALREASRSVIHLAVLRNRRPECQPSPTPHVRPA